MSVPLLLSVFTTNLLLVYTTNVTIITVRNVLNVNFKSIENIPEYCNIITYSSCVQLYPAYYSKHYHSVSSVFLSTAVTVHSLSSSNLSEPLWTRSSPPREVYRGRGQGTGCYPIGPMYHHTSPYWSKVCLNTLLALSYSANSGVTGASLWASL